MTNHFQQNCHPFQRLAKGDLVIYEIIQLWNYRDKTKADIFEDALLTGIEKASQALSIPLEKYPVFMPFRDSDEEDIVVEDKGKVIFDEDMARIDCSTYAMIGFSDGLVRDGGAFFEYGRAAALGIPTLLFISDFIYFTNRYKDCGGMKENVIYYVDPVVEYSLGKILIKNDLPLPPEDLLTSSRNIKYAKAKKQQFRWRLDSGFSELMAIVSSETERLCLQPENYINTFHSSSDMKETNYVYLEFEGICEWQIQKMLEITHTLNKFDIRVKTPQRFDRDLQERCNSEEAFKELALTDLHAALGASAIVTCGENWDVAPGPAFIQGIASVKKIPVVLYYTANRQFNAKGGTETLVNLMIEYSATKIAKSTKELVSQIVEIWKTIT